MSQTAQIGLGTVTALIPELLLQHGGIVTLVMQTQKLWAPHQDEAVKIYGEYNSALAKTDGGMMNQAAIILDIMALHPDVSQLIENTLLMWQNHIVEGVAVLKYLQATATNAAKGA